MPSIPARIPTPPVRRVRSAVARCRCRSEAAIGAPGGRGPGEPLNLGGRAIPAGALPPPAAAAPPPRGPGPGASAALTTLPPSATPKDEFDLGIGYMQRKDYALAEETMKNFARNTRAIR